MPEYFERYRPPILSGDPDDHILKLTWQLLVVIKTGSLLISTIFLLQATIWPDRLISIGLGSIIIFAGYYLLGRLERGETALVNHIICSSLYVVAVVNAFFYDGIRGINVTIFFIIICFAGILRGLNGLKIYGSLSLLALTVFYFLEVNDFLPTTVDISLFSPLAYHLILGLTFSIVGLLVGSAVTNLNYKARALEFTLDQLKETTVSKKYVDRIIDSMADLLLVFNHELKLETVNQTVKGTLGYSESSIKSLSLPDLFPESNMPGWVESLAAGRPLTQSVQGEVCLLKQDGTTGEFRLTAAPMRDSEDQSFIVCVAYDITQRKELERTLVRARDEAESIARTKSEFLATMSHEIRTPMNGVIGMTELLKDTPLNERQLEFVQTIHKSGKSLLVIINDILDYSKIEANRVILESFPFVLRDSVQTAVDTVIQLALQKDLPVTFKIAPGLPTVLEGDETRLRQILINLLSNSIKFTEQGHVEIQVNYEFLNEEEIKLQFVIEDTGIGIAPEKAEKLFEPFFQGDGSTTRKYGGTGLGLGISRRLAELMGGQMWLESEVGVGSRFIFTVVLNTHRMLSASSLVTDECPEVVSNPTTQEQLGEVFPLKVLLVEDNRVNQKVAASLLNRIGYQPDVAENGEQALEAAAKKEYDVIFMDIHMPIMDGLEATKKIKDGACLGSPPIVIAVTASVTDEDRRLCLEAGMDDVLHKPLTTNCFGKAIRNAVKLKSVPDN